jgi:polar amino acid transport system substrate-binding protein
LCGIALGALPQLSLARPAVARELAVVGAHMEGIYMRGHGGEFAGLGADLLRLLAQRHAYQLRFELYPWARAMQVVGSGKADVLVAPYKSAERERLLRYGEQAFFQDEVTFYVRASSLPVWEGDYALLKGRRIAVINGWTYGAAFAEALPKLHASATNSVESGLKMLAHGHVEMFASNRRDTDPVIAALGLQDKLMPLAPLIDVQQAYFAYPLSPRIHELSQQMDQMLAEMKVRGELQKLARRYGVTPP